MADVDLPTGTVLVGTTDDSEHWHYSVHYDDAVAFLRNQFATGRKYDTRGATWWHNLPPCYRTQYDRNTATPYSESPPQGWDIGDSTMWLWEDSSMSLSVEVFGPSSPNAIANTIFVYYMPPSPLDTCNRQ
jgi:hypothetical protein